MKTNKRKLKIFIVVTLFMLAICGCTSKPNDSKSNDDKTKEEQKEETPMDIINSSIENLKKQSSFHVEMVSEYTPMNEYYSGNKTIRNADYQKDGDSYIMTDNYKEYMYCNEEYNKGSEEKFCTAGETGYESYYYNDHGKRYQVQNGHTTAIEEKNVLGADIGEFFPQVTDYQSENEIGITYSNLKVENIKFDVEENGNTKVITYTYKQIMFDAESPDDKDKTYIDEVQHIFTIENDILTAHHCLDKADSFATVDQVKINQPRTMETDIKYSNLNDVTVTLN